jgi:hypothetical protein
MKMLNPPTIADLRAEVVASAWVWRTRFGCAHGWIAFDAMRMALRHPLIALATTFT